MVYALKVRVLINMGCLGLQDLELSAEERQACREALKRLLRNIYQPIVIQQLLLLQNGPRKVSLCLHHDCLMVQVDTGRAADPKTDSFSSELWESSLLNTRVMNLGTC